MYTSTQIMLCILTVCICRVYYTAKLAGRAQKVAHFMLRKLGGGRAVKPGDRVALVFRPDEAPSFVSAFYGCIIAAVIPVCIEPPITKEVCMLVGAKTFQNGTHVIFVCISLTATTDLLLPS